VHYRPGWNTFRPRPPRSTLAKINAIRLVLEGEHPAGQSASRRAAAGARAAKATRPPKFSSESAGLVATAWPVPNCPSAWGVKS
jgi:hypothetical protein